MTSAQSESEVQCIANKVRPPPEKDEFEWSIDNWSGNLNEVLINDQDPVSVNDTVDESIGLTHTTTHSIKLKFDAALDGASVKCKVNHVGWNNQVGDRNDTAYGEVEVQGPPVPSDGMVYGQNSEQTFEVGEPAVIYIPFHSNPKPTWLTIQPSDIAPANVTVNQNLNSSTYGRYTAERWVYENKSEVRNNAGDRKFLAILKISELEKDDMERTHIMSVSNGLGITNYTFTIPNIEGGGLSGGAIAGIVIGVLAGVLLIAVVAVILVKRKNKKKSQKIKEDRRRRKREEGRADNQGYES
jgi:hypothetical protein